MSKSTPLLAKNGLLGERRRRRFGQAEKIRHQAATFSGKLTRL
jgi:hypothetical protein